MKGGWHTGGSRHHTHPAPEHASPCLRAIPTHAHRRSGVRPCCFLSPTHHPKTGKPCRTHRACARNGHRNLIVAKCVYGRTLGELTRVRIRHRPLGWEVYSDSGAGHGRGVTSRALLRAPNKLSGFCCAGRSFIFRLIAAHLVTRRRLGHARAGRAGRARDSPPLSELLERCSLGVTGW